MPVFGTFDNGGDLVETSFLMQGLLAARQYFHGASKKSRLYTAASPICGRQWNGTGIARLRRVTFSTGIGRRSGHGRFTIRSSASMR